MASVLSTARTLALIVIALVYAASAWSAIAPVDDCDEGSALFNEQLSYEKVTDLFTRNKPQKLIHLTLDDGQVISATENHPFKTTDGWRDAVMLKKGGKLLLKSGDGEQVATIADIRIDNKTLPVFNLEVANAHTFFVGTDGAVVHNGYGSYTCTFKSGKKYHGKGDADRAKKSGEREAKRNNDPVEKVEHKPEANDRDSFKAEHERIKNDGGVGNPNNYNRVNSPGAKY